MTRTELEVYVILTFKSRLTLKLVVLEISLHHSSLGLVNHHYSSEGPGACVFNTILP